MTPLPSLRKYFSCKFLPIICVGILYFLGGINAAVATSARPMDVLPSWNNGPVKQRIIQFVNTVTNVNSPYFVAPADRIAVFDNDGTLWVEQPLYTQMVFAMDRIKTLAATHPEWKTEAPFMYVLNKQYDKLTMQDFIKILAVTHSGMSVQAYEKIVEEWFKIAKHPRFDRPYTELIYKPMIDVMHYLIENDFIVYIVSGGGQDFMRAYIPRTYGFKREHIIGTINKTKYIKQSFIPELIKQPEILLVDDGPGKVEAINMFIGKKPIIAFGNSVGDAQMLEWTQSGDLPGRRLMLLVHHDDAKREYAYDTQSNIGTFSEALMQEAQANGWKVISMKNDWKVIFPFEKSSPYMLGNGHPALGASQHPSRDVSRNYSEKLI